MKKVDRLAGMKPAIAPHLLNDALFRELMAEGLAMQGRFSAEPVYAKTGKGHLKSAGVAGIFSGPETSPTPDSVTIPPKGRLTDHPVHDTALK